MAEDALKTLRAAFKNLGVKEDYTGELTALAQMQFDSEAANKIISSLQDIIYEIPRLAKDEQFRLRSQEILKLKRLAKANIKDPDVLNSVNTAIDSVDKKIKKTASMMKRLSSGIKSASLDMAGALVGSTFGSPILAMVVSHIENKFKEMKEAEREIKLATLDSAKKDARVALGARSGTQKTTRSTAKASTRKAPTGSNKSQSAPKTPKAPATPAVTEPAATPQLGSLNPEKDTRKRKASDVLGGGPIMPKFEGPKRRASEALGGPEPYIPKTFQLENPPEGMQNNTSSKNVELLNNILEESKKTSKGVRLLRKDQADSRRQKEHDEEALEEMAAQTAALNKIADSVNTLEEKAEDNDGGILDNFMKGLRGSLGGASILGALGEGLLKGGAIIHLGMSIFDSLKESIIGAMQEKTFLGAISKGMVTFGEKLVENLSFGFFDGNSLDPIRLWMTDQIEAFMNGINSAGQFFSDIADQTIDQANQFYTNTVTMLENTWNAVTSGDWWMDQFDKLAGIFDTSSKEMVEGVGNWFKETIGSKDWWIEKLGGIVDTLIPDWAVDSVKFIGDKLQKGAKIIADHSVGMANDIGLIADSGVATANAAVSASPGQKELSKDQIKSMEDTGLIKYNSNWFSPDTIDVNKENLKNASESDLKNLIASPALSQEDRDKIGEEIMSRSMPTPKAEPKPKPKPLPAPVEAKPVPISPEPKKEQKFDLVTPLPSGWANDEFFATVQRRKMELAEEARRAKPATPMPKMDMSKIMPVKATEINKPEKDLTPLAIKQAKEEKIVQAIADQKNEPKDESTDWSTAMRSASEWGEKQYDAGMKSIYEMFGKGDEYVPIAQARETSRRNRYHTAEAVAPIFAAQGPTMMGRAPGTAYSTTNPNALPNQVASDRTGGGVEIMANGTAPTGGLGSLSEKYEAARAGSKAIGYDSTGGTSYGKYQIASKTGTMDEFLNYTKNRNPEVYERLKNAGPANSGGKGGKFAEEWKALAGEGKLADLEHGFIKSTHYDKQLERIRKSNPAMAKQIEGSKALQDVLWSTSVQQRNLSKGIFNNSWKEGISNEDFIRNIYAERGADGGKKYFSRSTEGVRQSVLKRYGREAADALALEKKQSKGMPMSEAQMQESVAETRNQRATTTDSQINGAQTRQAQVKASDEAASERQNAAVTMQSGVTAGKLSAGGAAANGPTASGGGGRSSGDKNKADYQERMFIFTQDMRERHV